MSSNPPGWGQPQDGSGGQGGPTPPPTPNAPPPGYQAAPGYGWGGQQMYARDHPDGTTILVLGILSLVVCGLLGPFAWTKGNSALREIDANPSAYTNRGNVSAGRICGIVATGLMVVSVLVVVLAVIAAGVSSSTG